MHHIINKAEPHITSNQAHGGIGNDGADSDDSNAADALPSKGQDEEKDVCDGKQAQVRFWLEKIICMLTRVCGVSKDTSWSQGFYRTGEIN